MLGVTQKGRWDCGIAALATVAGVDYEDAKKVLVRNPADPVVFWGDASPEEKRVMLDQVGDPWRHDSPNEYFRDLEKDPDPTDFWRIGITELEITWALFRLKKRSVLLPNFHNLEETWVFPVAPRLTVPHNADIQHALTTQVGLCTAPGETEGCQHYYAFGQGKVWDCRPGRGWVDNGIRILKTTWENGEIPSLVLVGTCA